MARKSMAKWIDECMADTEKEHQISAFSVCHVILQQRQEIHSVQLKKGHTYDGKSLEGILKGKAETHAQNLENTQRFIILAFYGTNEPEAFFPFNVLPEADPAIAGMGSEPATVEGQRAQGMRWMDSGMVQIFRRQQAQDDHAIRMMEAQDRMLARAQSMIEKLMVDNMDAFSLVKGMLADQAKRENDYTMEQMKFHRSTQEREKLLKFAPALINSLLGVEVFPQGVADSALIETIADNIGEKEIQKLMELELPPELMGPLSNRIMKAMEDKQKREAAAKNALVPYKGSAEDDVAGGT